MNVDLARINARVSKIQGDCKNASSQFCQDVEFRTQEITRVDAAIQTLRDHISQDLPDLSELQASWDRFKSNISEMGPLEDIKNRIVSLAEILVPSAGPAAAAEEDPDVQAAIDDAEEEKAAKLEFQKKRLPQDKPNLFKAIDALSRNIVDGKYGNIIKTACMEQHPSIVYRDAFLRLLFIEKSLSEPALHTQHEMEWDLSEEEFERLSRLQEEIKNISSEERISLLQKISYSEEEVTLTENEKKLFDTLNEAIHLIKITKDEELIYPELLYERAEEIEKVSKSYKAAFNTIKKKPSTPFQQGQFLAKTIAKLGSANPRLFFDAIDYALADLLSVEDRNKTQPVIRDIIYDLDEELKKDPQIMRTFSKKSVLWGYFREGMNHEDPLVNSRDARFSMLMIPTLLEEDPEFALKLAGKLLDFLGESEEEVAVPLELIQNAIKHQPQIATKFIPYLSRQESVQYFIQQIYAVKESGQQGEIPELFEISRFEAQRFIKEILFAYWDEFLQQPSKESGDLAKLKIRQFLAYFRSELKEFFPDRSSEEIEFDLLNSCFETSETPFSNNPIALLLIPELVRIGKKEMALEISSAVLKQIKTFPNTVIKQLSYALLKSAGLNWSFLDVLTLGPLVDAEAAGSYPLDPDFTVLYLVFMRFLADPENYIGDVIDVSMALDPLAREFRNESYGEFSLQVADLLKEMLIKTSNQLSSIRDPVRKVKTFSRLFIGFSLVGPIDRVIPTAESTLKEIYSSGFTEEQFLRMLGMLANHLISSIKIIHKKQGDDVPEMQSLKASLVDFLFETINRMPNIEDRIYALFQIPGRLEVEFHEHDVFYVGLSLRAMNQTFSEILGWDASGASIQEKIQALEDLLEMAEPFSQELPASIRFQIQVDQMNLTDYRVIQDELKEFETRQDIDPVRKIERCIELIEQGQDPDTRDRILTLYQNSIDQVENPKQDELRSAMNASLAASDRTSPEDED